MANEAPGDADAIPRRAEMEARLHAKVVTFDDGGVERPGGMCGCCGCGPKTEPEWGGDPWYVYRAGLCDADGIYFSMLCEGCLEELRTSNAARAETERDRIAREISELMGDDLDGAQAMMEDLE